MDDFVLNFDEIYVCRFFEPPTWMAHAPILGEWRGKTAGGCSNFATVGDNPQFALTVTDALTKVVLALGDDAAPMLTGLGATAYLQDARGAWRVVGGEG